MIGLEDARFTYDYGDYYKILPNIFGWDLDPKRIKNGIKVAKDFRYSSDNNQTWMSKDELASWVSSNLAVTENNDL